MSVNDQQLAQEFGRLNISGSVTSKRYVRELVEGGFVDGWDDPRLPTLRGLRRRGVKPEGIRRFLADLGVLRSNSMVDPAMLDHYIRQDLKECCYNAMAVMKPLKVVLTNMPEDWSEQLVIPNHERDISMGQREVPFSRELYIEQEDFMEVERSGSSGRVEYHL